jgi:tRNA-binding protein
MHTPAQPAPVPADHFFAVDLRVGTVVAAEPFPEARTPGGQAAHRLRARSRRAAVQRAAHATVRAGRPRGAAGGGRGEPAAPPRGGFRSEVLVLGAVPEPGDVALLAVDVPVPNGTRVA